METVEHPYHPHFEAIYIERPTVIGAEADYSPFFRLLESGIFRIWLDHNQVPTREILEYIRMLHFRLIDIEGLVEYNKEKLAVRMQLTSDMMSNGHEHIDILMEAFNRMIIQLKMGIYEKHPLKSEADNLHTRMVNMIRSINIGGYGTEYEYIKERLHQIDRQLNLEMDRIFMSVAGVEKFRPMPRFEKPIVEKPKKPSKSEEEEFAEIEKYLTDAKDTLKLDLKAIRKLHKDKSNKFVLPLYASDPKDVIKFTELTEQPFNFLSYNGAMFSCDLISSLRETWLDTTDESMWQSLWNERLNDHRYAKIDIKKKTDSIIERQKKLGKVYNKLGKQIDEMKSQFVSRVDKYKNPKMLKFIAGRTESNIKTIREAEALAKRKIDVLKNKKLTSRPIQFFERAVTLYLGKTGEDIIQDLYTLGYTSFQDHQTAIEYLWFLMRMLENRGNKYVAPVLPILSDREFEFGFEKPEILKVLAGHMFIHTVTLSKKQPKYREVVKKPKPPKARMVKE